MEIKDLNGTESKWEGFYGHNNYKPTIFQEYKMLKVTNDLLKAAFSPLLETMKNGPVLSLPPLKSL